jgi:glutaredoxin
MAAGYIVYWQPGCTSCLAAKEFLRRHGIEFDSVNVREDPRAAERLAALGARSVPVVARGARYVLGQDLEELARFVGVSVDRSPLPPAMLAARLIALLDRAAAMTRRIPSVELTRALPGRKRTCLDIAYHVPQIVVAFLDAAAGGRLTFEHFNRAAPEHLRDADAVAAVTERTARSFAQWWCANGAAPATTLDTYYGPQPTHAVLERTTWHVAQHLRQLERVFVAHGDTSPDVRLDPTLLEGLPLPDDAWDAEVPLP